jgi:hypothetical protein
LATFLAGSIVLVTALLIPFGHLLAIANTVTLSVFALVDLAFCRLQHRDSESWKSRLVPILGVVLSLVLIAFAGIQLISPSTIGYWQQREDIPMPQTSSVAGENRSRIESRGAFTARPRISGVLLRWIRFASEQRLVDEQVTAMDEAPVCRDQIARDQVDDISWDELVHGHESGRAIASNRGADRNRRSASTALCARNSCRKSRLVLRAMIVTTMTKLVTSPAAAERARDEQNDDERATKPGEELESGRCALRPCGIVRTIDRKPPRCLFNRQAGGRRSEPGHDAVERLGRDVIVIDIGEVRLRRAARLLGLAFAVPNGSEPAPPVLLYQASFQLPSGCRQLVSVKRSDGVPWGGLMRYSIRSHRCPCRENAPSNVTTPELPLSGFFQETEAPGFPLWIC